MKLRAKVTTQAKQKRTQLAFKLTSQTVDMLPLKSGFIEEDFGRNMISDSLQCLAFKDAKGNGLDGLKENIFFQGIISKEFEYLPSLF